MVDFLPVPAPSAAAREAVAVALAANPRGASFGRLAAPAAWLAGCQDAVPAAAPQAPRVVIFVGHHGIAQRGISAFAPEATEQQAAQLADAASPAHALARRVGASIEVVNCPANAAIDVADALDSAGLAEALSAGRAAADRAVDSGADLLIPADLGVGNTTVAAAVMARLVGREPVVMVGRGSGISDEGWKHKVAVLRDAMFRARKLSDPLELVQVIGGADLAALVGFIAQAAARRTPMLIDSPLVSVAAALAERLAPGTAAWLLATGTSYEPAHAAAYEDLGLEPLLDLKTTTGQGVGALAALQLINSGVELVADEMAAQAALKESAGSGSGSGSSEEPSA